MLPIGSRYSRLGGAGDSSHGRGDRDLSLDDSEAAANIHIRDGEDVEGGVLGHGEGTAGVASAASASASSEGRGFAASFLSGGKAGTKRRGAGTASSGAKYGKITCDDNDDGAWEGEGVGTELDEYTSIDGGNASHVVPRDLEQGRYPTGSSRGIELRSLVSGSSSSSSSNDHNAVINKMHEPSSDPIPSYTVRVQNKESRIDITSLRPSSSVLDLAVAIEAQTGVQLRRQRLVLNGRALELRSTLTLATSGVQHMSCVHLFQRQQDVPLPEDVANPSAAAGANARGNRSSNATNTSGILTATNQSRSLIIYDQEDVFTSLAAAGSSREMIMEAYVRHLAPEVRLWCYVLFFSSLMTLTDKFTYLSDTGTLGKNGLDSLVGALEILSSMAGAYVAMLGFRATQEMTRETLQKYVTLLTYLAYGVAVMRILWVYDILLRARESLEEYEANNISSGSDASIDPNTGEEKHGGDAQPVASPTLAPYSYPRDEASNDDLSADPYSQGGSDFQVSSESMFIYFSVQVLIVAAIYTFAWVFCVSRAVRLRSAYDHVLTLRQERRAQERRELDALVASAMARSDDAVPST